MFTKRLLALLGKEHVFQTNTTSSSMLFTFCEIFHNVVPLEDAAPNSFLKRVAYMKILIQTSSIYKVLICKSSSYLSHIDDINSSYAYIKFKWCYYRIKIYYLNTFLFYSLFYSFYFLFK